MKPIATETTNLILKGTEENVDDLPVTRMEFDNGVPAVESCWELSTDELLEVVRTGKIYFLCLGETHPPIYLGTQSATIVKERGVEID